MRLAVPSSRLPYPIPKSGEPVRLAFVGQETYFHPCSLNIATKTILPTFIEYRGGDEQEEEMMETLEAFTPHVVIVFRPEIISPGSFAGLRAATVGYLTEPLPRSMDGDVHPDLAWRLEEYKLIDRSNYDRIISFDPLLVSTADELAPVWRSFALPVDDRHFRPVRPPADPPRILFIGRSTEHREHFLIPVKHDWDILHIAYGVHGDKLFDLFDAIDVGINIHNEPYPSFENRVCLHLAAGHLVISEPLSPSHGLEPAIDFLEVHTPEDLGAGIWALQRYPDVFDRVRRRGRRKAEDFRASRVYPPLVHDLLLDLAAFGTERPLDF